MHIYDYIIIGSGLTGLTIAHKVSQETKNVLLLESQDEFGGANKPAQLAGQVMNNGLRFYPATDSSLKALENLETQLKVKLVSSIIENNPKTYEASGFKPFIGFGERSPIFYDQLSYFLSSKSVELSLQPYEWVQRLKETFQGTLLTRSFVTQFHFEDLTAKNQKVTHVTVNGNKTFHAHNFIFAAPLKELPFLLPEEIMNARLKNKIAKAKSWQAVCIDLFHPDFSAQEKNLFVLNGTTDDEIGPCLGQFINKETSQWLSFIDFDSAEDTENIGNVLKKVKRQIKRAFPEIADKIQKERIYVSSSISGGDLKLSASLNYPNIANLWIASVTAATAPNLLGSLQTAQMVTAALGFANVVDHKPELTL